VGTLRSATTLRGHRGCGLEGAQVPRLAPAGDEKTAWSQGRAARLGGATVRIGPGAPFGAAVAGVDGVQDDSCQGPSVGWSVGCGLKLCDNKIYDVQAPREAAADRLILNLT